MKRGLWLILVAVLLVSNGGAVAQSTTHMTLVLQAEWDKRDAKAGEACAIWGLIPGSADSTTEFPQQVLVRNESDTIIGVVDIPRDGTWETGRTSYCVATVTVDVASASFYTVEIRDIFAYTVSAGELAQREGELQVIFPED